MQCILRHPRVGWPAVIVCSYVPLLSPRNSPFSHPPPTPPPLPPPPLTHVPHRASSQPAASAASAEPSRPAGLPRRTALTMPPSPRLRIAKLDQLGASPHHHPPTHAPARPTLRVSCPRHRRHHHHQLLDPACLWVGWVCVYACVCVKSHLIFLSSDRLA